MAYNILLVDDSETTRAIIRKTLRLANIDVGDVLEAADGKEALELLAGNWVDLVFADINMPVMDGMELIDRMIENGMLDSVPVVVVSTEGSAQRAEELQRKGVAAYLRKPFTPEELGRLVEELLITPPEASVSAIEEALFDALEGYAFLIGERIDEPEVARERPAVVSMRFSGDPASGTAWLAVPAEACATIAASALGEAVDNDGVRGCDALKELLNVSCGRALSSLYGDDPVFDLTPPSVEPPRAKLWEDLAAKPLGILLDVEGTPMLFALDIERSL